MQFLYGQINKVRLINIELLNSIKMKAEKETLVERNQNLELRLEEVYNNIKEVINK